MSMGKMGIMASVMGMVSSVFRTGARFNVGATLGGFNNQTAAIEKPQFYVDRHISPALIRRRPSRTSNYKKKTNRLHLKKKAKITRRKAA